MIRFERVSVRYEGTERPTLSGVDLTVPEGELVLLVGPSGVGKSTLLGTVSGLVPHFTGGLLSGRVTVDGRDTRTHKPRELADLVGTVGQDPLAHFVTDTVEDELAYGMESLGLAPDVMRRRVEETLDLLGLAELRDRPIATLSGGQQQRVAIGSVLTPHPKVLVLDEPTSALDPAAAEEVLAVLQRLVHDLGTTVLMAEHRLERVVQYADQVVLLPAPGAPPVMGPPDGIMKVAPARPPVADRGLLAGWDPLPLSVRDARRAAGGLRERLAGAAVPVRGAGGPPGGAGGGAGGGGGGRGGAEPGQGGGGQLLDHPGGGRLVPGVHGGVEGRPRQLCRDGHGERRAVQMGDAGGVGRVRRPFRYRAHEVAERGFGPDALLRQDRGAEGARVLLHGLGPSGGQRPAPRPGGVPQGVQDDGGEGPQVLRPLCTARDEPSPYALGAGARRRTGPRAQPSTFHGGFTGGREGSRRHGEDLRSWCGHVVRKRGAAGRPRRRKDPPPGFAG
ncbi:energy-coupling factor ABC transporter ATP-binding protein [Streptomyces sp. 7G]|nr:ABC transporter ATP-binding protein [Streptomyces sp. 7G]MCA1269248.1 energy-coupling factor ABC transporter ATP-binding protein [Streptomyces sp. 7G]